MKLRFLIPFLILPLLASAQHWAPDSAEWHYDFSLSAERGYIKISVAGDSVINGQPVRVLTKYKETVNLQTGALSNGYIGNEYTYEDSGRVYYYHDNDFYMLYDFNANPGDSWVIAGASQCDTISVATVDSVSYVTVNNDTLKVLFMDFDLSEGWQLTGEVYERIGSVGYMFPEPFCVADANEGGSLRCYNDPYFGFFQTSVSESCVSTGVIGKEQLYLKVFPIPATDELKVEFPQGQFSYLTFFDITGKKILSVSISKNDRTHTFDVKHLPAGIYQILFTGKTSENSISKKVVIK